MLLPKAHRIFCVKSVVSLVVVVCLVLLWFFFFPWLCDRAFVPEVWRKPCPRRRLIVYLDPCDDKLSISSQPFKKEVHQPGNISVKQRGWMDPFRARILTPMRKSKILPYFLLLILAQRLFWPLSSVVLLMSPSCIPLTSHLFSGLNSASLQVSDSGRNLREMSFKCLQYADYAASCKAAEKLNVLQ